MKGKGEHMKSKTLYQFCITSLRYSQGRDNHLAPHTAIENINEALNHMDNDFELATAKQIIEEINRDLEINKREYAWLWVEFVEDLKNRIEHINMKKV
jgi:hypothetical protein